MLTVKEWRKAKSLSIAAVAKTLEVSPITWAGWEERPEKIPIGKMFEFCKLVGTDLSQIIFLP